MKAKIEIIENLGCTDKTPPKHLGVGCWYEIQKVKYNDIVFYRRQKFQKNGRITSVSYASEINAKRWESNLHLFLGIIEPEKQEVQQSQTNKSQISLL
jgi:hypothetical protein